MINKLIKVLFLRNISVSTRTREAEVQICPSRIAVAPVGTVQDGDPLNRSIPCRLQEYALRTGSVLFYIWIQFKK